ncbi:MAG TPA: hypothetical protein VIJ81_10450 [Sphingomicrobium sp.]|jgi:hypothetical protein|nr:hypothetical protein [Sphingomicrobium sp.]
MAMVRVGSFLLLMALGAMPAVAESTAPAEILRIREIPSPSPDPQLPAINVGSTAQFGLGMFGLKPQTPRNRPVVGYEVSAPKQRRAGVGFSLKF